MARRPGPPMKKVTIRVYTADWAILTEMARLQDIEPNRVLREMLHSYVNQSSALARRNIDRLRPPPAFSMDELKEAVENV